jgi:hypothetical protein
MFIYYNIQFSSSFSPENYFSLPLREDRRVGLLLHIIDN